MLQMRNESGTDLNEECFELVIGRMRDERVVERIKDRLMIGNFVIDIRAVKRSTAQLFQGTQVLVATLLQALAGRIRFGRHVELGHERTGRLVNAAVVGDHPLRKVFNLL